MFSASRFAAFVFFAALFLFCAALATQAQQPWTFAVSGDSRNCGDVIMPAIAVGAHHDQAAFYWHLGDFRAPVFYCQSFELKWAGADPRRKKKQPLGPFQRQKSAENFTGLSSCRKKSCVRSNK